MGPVPSARTDQTPLVRSHGRNRAPFRPQGRTSAPLVRSFGYVSASPWYEGVRLSDLLDELPVVFGIYALTGELLHVDDVENGKACDCVCPDPNCGQRLIAKNGGKKKIHHFAHERGSCSWGTEYLISLLALEAVTERGRITFPTLSFYDALKREEVVHARAASVRVSGAELKEVSGRQAPDLILTWRSRTGSERTFAVVFQLVHRVTDEQVARLAAVTEGVILVDLRADMRRIMREQGRHADRSTIALTYQDVDFLADVLSNPQGDLLYWAYNATAEHLHAESIVRKDEADRVERERRRAEEERRRAEREAREAELAQAREEERRRRVERERRKAEQERRRAEEERREEAMRPEHDHEYLPQMQLLVAQQEEPAIDAFGRRWCACAVCGKVAPEREFSIVGGRHGLNGGICTECLRKMS